MKERIQRIALITHIVSIILSMILLFGLSIDDHVRWYLGYVVVWIVFISALVALCTLPHKAKKGKVYYFFSVLFAPIAVLFFSFFLGIVGFLMLLVLHKTFIPQKKIAENQEYIIRNQPTSMALLGDHIYRKSGMLERLVGRIDNRENPYDPNIESFRVERDSIYIHYRTNSQTDTICVFNIITDKNNSINED